MKKANNKKKQTRGQVVRLPRPDPLPAPIEYATIQSLDEFRFLAADADLIVAVDSSHRSNQAIVFGTQTLEEIVASGKSKTVRAVSFAINFRATQLEHLLAAVGTVKGQYEWNGKTHIVSE
jgi:hypothetical protein